MPIDFGTTDLTYELNFWEQVIARVERELPKLPVSPHPHNRFAIHWKRARDVLQNRDQSSDRSLLGQRRIQQAFLDLRVLDLVCSELQPADRWQSHLIDLFGGNDFSWKDRNDKARNTEFELHFATVLHRAGFRVWPGEPDLRFNAFGWDLAIAAKRLRSPKQLEARLKDGFDQLCDHKIPGFVVVDAAVCCIARDKQIQRSNVEHLEFEIGSQLTMLAETAGRYLLRARENSPFVLGALITAALPCIVGESSGFQFVPFGGRHWISFVAESDCRMRKLNRMVARIAKVPLI